MAVAWFVITTATQANARSFYAFSRDKGLPDRGFFARVNKRTRQPINAVWLVVILCIALVMLAFASQIAVFAIFSLAAFGMDLPTSSRSSPFSCSRTTQTFNLNPALQPRTRIPRQIRQLRRHHLDSLRMHHPRLPPRQELRSRYLQLQLGDRDFHPFALVGMVFRQRQEALRRSALCAVPGTVGEARRRRHGERGRDQALALRRSPSHLKLQENDRSDLEESSTLIKYMQMSRTTTIAHAFSPARVKVKQEHQGLKRQSPRGKQFTASIYIQKHRVFALLLSFAHCSLSHAFTPYC